MSRVPGIEQGVERVDPHPHARQQRLDIGKCSPQRCRAAHVAPGAKRLGRPHQPEYVVDGLAADRAESYAGSAVGLGDLSGCKFSINHHECSRFNTSLTWFTVLFDSVLRACEGFMPITTNGGEFAVQPPTRPSAKRWASLLGSGSKKSGS